MKNQILCVMKSILLLSLLLYVTPVMSQYKPPKNQKPPSGHTKSGGVRGCPEERIPTILSPINYIGQTASRRPTFAWYLKTPYKTEFRIFEFNPDGEPKRLGEKVDIQASTGINQYSLGENHPELTVGKKYLWQVSVFCPDVSTYISKSAEFIVTETPASIKNQPTVSHSQKAIFYAEQGFWYDALGEALKLSKSGKLGELGSNLVLSLAQSEEKAATSSEKQRIQSLKMIANQEK